MRADSWFLVMCACLTIAFSSLFVVVYGPDSWFFVAFGGGVIALVAGLLAAHRCGRAPL